MGESEQCWTLYLIRCGDDSLYTGITTDVNRRLKEHNGDAGKGAKSLRGKRPLTLAFEARARDRSAALKLEYRVKQLSKTEKEALVSRRLDINELPA